MPFEATDIHYPHSSSLERCEECIDNVCRLWKGLVSNERPVHCHSENEYLLPCLNSCLKARPLNWIRPFVYLGHCLLCLAHTPQIHSLDNFDFPNAFLACYNNWKGVISALRTDGSFINCRTILQLECHLLLDFQRQFVSTSIKRNVGWGNYSSIFQKMTGTAGTQNPLVRNISCRCYIWPS